MREDNRWRYAPRSVATIVAVVMAVAATSLVAGPNASAGSPGRSVALSLPGRTGIGGNPELVPLTITDNNVSDGPAGASSNPGVSLDFTASGAVKLAADIALTVRDAGKTDSTPVVVPLQSIGYGLEGTVTVPGLSLSSSSVSHVEVGLRLRDGLTPGSLALAARLIDSASGAQLAPTVSAATAAQLPIATLSLPSSILVGTGTAFLIKYSNLTGTDYPSANVHMDVTGPSLRPGDVSVMRTDGQPTAPAGGDGSYHLSLADLDLAPGVAAQIPILLNTFPSSADGTITVTVNITYLHGSTTRVAHVSPRIALVSLPGTTGAPVVAPGDQKLAVSWGVASTGGLPVTYTVVLQDGVKTRTVTTDKTSYTFSGLFNTHTYTVTVTPVNDAGSGPTSVATAGSPNAAAGGDATVSIAVAKTFVPYGKTLYLTGTVVRGAVGVQGAQVLLAETYNDGRSAPIGAVTTNSVGVWSFRMIAVYGGVISATFLSESAVAPVRAVATFRSVTSSVSKHAVQVTAVIRPGFIVTPQRQARAQLVLTTREGRQVKVLTITNAQQRRGVHGELHGVNVIAFKVVLPSGRYRLAVRLLGTPASTGALSQSTSVIVSN